MKNNKIISKIKDLENSILRILCQNNLINNNPNNLTYTQIKIIKYLLDNHNKNIYQKDLEKILNLRKATLSGVLKTMEKNDLIEKIANEYDARSKKIILNKKVSDTIKKDLKKINNLENILIKDIEKSELDIFITVLDKMKNNLNNINTI